MNPNTDLEEIRITIRTIDNGFVVSRTVGNERGYVHSGQTYFPTLPLAADHALLLIGSAENDASRIEADGEPDF